MPAWHPVNRALARAPRAGERASAHRARPCGGPGRLEPPRCSRNGSSRRSPSPGQAPGPLYWSGRALVPVRKPGFSWPSPSSVPFFVFPCAAFGGGLTCLSHPRTFGGHREQQLNVTCADLGPQGSVESATVTGPHDATRLGQLRLPEPTEPRTSPRAFSVEQQSATGAHDYSDQCTGTLPGAAPNAGADRRWRLAHSFLGCSGLWRSLRGPALRRPHRLFIGKVGDGFGLFGVAGFEPGVVRPGVGTFLAFP